MLDGEESELVFIDHASSEISVSNQVSFKLELQNPIQLSIQMENALATYMPDAMVIVYSVVDSDSLNSAEEMLQYLWKTSGSGPVSNSDKAVILVGNKADLVRTRTVSIVGKILWRHTLFQKSIFCSKKGYFQKDEGDL